VTQWGYSRRTLVVTEIDLTTDASLASLTNREDSMNFAESLWRDIFATIDPHVVIVQRHFVDSFNRKPNGLRELQQNAGVPPHARTRTPMALRLNDLRQLPWRKFWPVSQQC